MEYFKGLLVIFIMGVSMSLSNGLNPAAADSEVPEYKRGLNTLNSGNSSHERNFPFGLIRSVESTEKLMETYQEPTEAKTHSSVREKLKSHEEDIMQKMAEAIVSRRNFMFGEASIIVELDGDQAAPTQDIEDGVSPKTSPLRNNSFSILKSTQHEEFGREQAEEGLALPKSDMRNTDEVQTRESKPPNEISQAGNQTVFHKERTSNQRTESLKNTEKLKAMLNLEGLEEKKFVKAISILPMLNMAVIDFKDDTSINEIETFLKSLWNENPHISIMEVDSEVKHVSRSVQSSGDNITEIVDPGIRRSHIKTQAAPSNLHDSDAVRNNRDFLAQKNDLKASYLHDKLSKEQESSPTDNSVLAVRADLPRPPHKDAVNFGEEQNISSFTSRIFKDIENEITPTNIREPFNILFPTFSQMSDTAIKPVSNTENSKNLFFGLQPGETPFKFSEYISKLAAPFRKIAAVEDPILHENNRFSFKRFFTSLLPSLGSIFPFIGFQQSILPNFLVSAPLGDTQQTNHYAQDPLFDSQWGLKNNQLPIADIKALRAWEIEATIRSKQTKNKPELRNVEEILIAHVDTGVWVAHEDLHPQIYTNEEEIPGNNIDDDNNGYVDDVHGWNFHDLNADVIDMDGHGTHTAGVVIANRNNDVGVAGVAKYAKLLPILFQDRVSEVVKAIDYGIMMGAKISTNSWGYNHWSNLLYAALKKTNTSGQLFICAVDNKGMDNTVFDDFPPNFNLPNMINVAAIKKDGRLDRTSNYGYKNVHIAAPGSEILSTLPRNLYGYKGGTSTATPHVAGVAVMLLGSYPFLTATEIKDLILSSTTKLSSLDGKIINSGLLNAGRAMELALERYGSNDG